MRKTAPSADMPSVPVPPAPAPMPGSGMPRELLMRHPRTGEERIAPVGYAWSVLLAGPFVLARRGDWSMALVCLLLPLLGQALLAPQANRRHLRRLVARGYRAVSTVPGRVSHVEWALGMQIPRYSGRREDISRFE